ncbi:MAG: SMP-30/gluconolactonase/LRE family protein [Proteobacteria bacterium]|nr:SMP-30/gluconolactonase/LRE family protein [Pseudomonadota bacterium]
MKAELLCDGYGLIEGPVWADDQGLYFSDVIFGGVFCLELSGTVKTIFEHRRGIGGMALHEAGGLIVSGRNIGFKSFDGETSITVFDNDADNGRVGFNDLTTDAAGRIYAGSLGSSPVFDDGLEPRAGMLYLIDLDGVARVVAQDVMLTNGLGFSPDGKTLYHSDSRRNAVFCYSVSADGSLGPKLPFAEPKNGIPDGLVVSEDGQVWVALADGGAGVAVYSHDGEQQDFISVPNPMCTSVCFGGADLKDLYIVTGSHGSDSERAGGVYRVRSTVAGLPVAKAKIKL